MRDYFLSAIAEADIDEIVSYIADNNTEAALRFLDALYESMDMLADNPYLGYKREFINDQTIRIWPFKWQYLIIYTEVSPIEIVRVLSGHRDVSNLLN